LHGNLGNQEIFGYGIAKGVTNSVNSRAATRQW
jgi:hypothetical protein